MTRRLDYRDSVLKAYPEVYSPAALEALEVLAPLNRDQHELMARRIARRLTRERGRQRIAFLDPQALIPRTGIRVQDARDGNFDGSEIPADLMRQWIQGTGPATRPRASTESGLRNIAYALLSGADGWMFDGEDALGQVDTMSLDNQRNLQLAIAKDPRFLRVAEKVSAEMNQWAQGFFGRPIVADWRQQLDFTTKIFRARGLHLDDRHVREKDGTGFSASIVDLALYVVNNHQRLRDSGASIVLYLPKIQTAEEAALWNDMLTALEEHLGLPIGTIKVYVLVEQIEASFQLMEIRAALGRHFVGFNTGRWDYINSVADAMAWDPRFINPNIDAITHDLRLHAQLRGPRAPGREHARSERPPRSVAGRYGAQHPGRLRGGRRRRHAQGEGPAASASNSRGRAASGWRTGRWCTSSGRYGRRSARTTSSNASSRRSPTRRRTPTGWCCSSRRRAPSAAPATC